MRSSSIATSPSHGLSAANRRVWHHVTKSSSSTHTHPQCARQRTSAVHLINSPHCRQCPNAVLYTELGPNPSQTPSKTGRLIRINPNSPPSPNPTPLQLHPTILPARHRAIKLQDPKLSTQPSSARDNIKPALNATPPPITTTTISSTTISERPKHPITSTEFSRQMALDWLVYDVNLETHSNPFTELLHWNQYRKESLRPVRDDTLEKRKGITVLIGVQLRYTHPVREDKDRRPNTSKRARGA